MQDEPAPVDDVDTGPVQAHTGFRLRMARVAVFRNSVEAFHPHDLRPVRCSALKLIALAGFNQALDRVREQLAPR